MDADDMVDTSEGMPTWVKWFLGVAMLLVAVAVVVVATGLGGEHGPGRHTPASDLGDTWPGALTDDLAAHDPEAKQTTGPVPRSGPNVDLAAPLRG